MDAYRTLESWIRTWSVPEEETVADPARVAGACVTLRLAGVVVGRSASMRGDGADLWRAARAARRQASQRLVIERDALRDERLRDAARRLAIDLQLAHELVPVSERTLDAASLAISPGVEGVAARLGDRIESLFPGTMLSTNVTTRRALQATINAYDLPPIGLGDPRFSLQTLRDDFALVVYRFTVTHLAQPGPAEPPIFLLRGDREVTLRDASPTRLRALGRDIAGHITRRAWPGAEPLGLLGVYEPWNDTYDEPLIAGPFEQALASMALARWAGVADAPSALREACRILADLAEIDLTETDPVADLAACAATILATVEIARARRLVAPEDPVERSALQLELQCVRALREADLDAIDPPARALVACALARRSALAREGDTDAAQDALRAREITSALLFQTPPAQLPALTPWVGWAALALAPEGEPIPAAAALREMRSLVWTHQLRAPDVGEQDQDLLGGVVFTRRGSPLPSWQTLRPVALLATMLGDHRVTPDDDLPREAATLAASLRFVAQLTVSSATAHMFVDPERAVGGVRPALWDQRLPLEISAMGLLTIAESLDALRVRADASSR